MTSLRWQCVLLGLALTACTSGVMSLRETHYYAPVNESNTNYYRLRVFAETKLGVSQYRSGWFPTTSVDRLFGKVDDEGGVKSLETRAVIESLLGQKVKDTYRAWLDSASNPTMPTAVLDLLQQSMRRILAYPLIGGAEPYPGALEVEYNPAKGVAIRRWDEKLVFILSSDPNDVVQKIANFSESDQTTRTINRFGQMLANRALGEVVSQEAALTVRAAADALLTAGIERTTAAATAVQGGDQAKLGIVNQEIETLLTLLEAGQP